MSEQDPTKRLTKAFKDATPKGPHPTPHAEWVSVRLDFVEEAIDHLEWLEKGIDEWRGVALTAQRRHEAAQATARIAITHLDAVLKRGKTYEELRLRADIAARDWLTSIGAT